MSDSTINEDFKILLSQKLELEERMRDVEDMLETEQRRAVRAEIERQVYLKVIDKLIEELKAK